MSFSSSWSLLGRSVLDLFLPTPVGDYRAVRPHHVVVLYAACRALLQTSLVTKLSNKILNLLSNLSEGFIPAIQAGVVPDVLIRFGIRLQLANHLVLLEDQSAAAELDTKMDIVKALKSAPIAIETAAANAQHYEVPAAFYDLSLGPRKKYSSGYWPHGHNTTFEESEVAMLELYCQRAGVTDRGMHIVDLGCGWGSLTLFLAERYPNNQITGISNSHSQREYIMNTAAEHGYKNVRVLTCNMAADDKESLAQLATVKNQDLIMTIEMFEHMKNYQILLHKIRGFLKPTTGQLFVHIFTHKDYAYHFEEGWMSETFFTGGTMPSDDLLLYFSQDFSIRQHWRVNGQHYEKTSNGWLWYLDQNWKNGSLKPVLAEAYGVGKEREWYVNWRLFFMACAELWGYAKGEEWIVSHYLFQVR